MPPLLKFFHRKKWLILGVKLVALEAPLRPVEQLDRRTSRGKSNLGADHHGCVID
jgi:hypothetical protein